MSSTTADSYVAKIKLNGKTFPISPTLKGICDTDSDTATKVVTCNDFDIPVDGCDVTVKFTYSNTATDPTLKINNTDPYPIYTYGTTSPGDTPDTSWYAGSVITFMFDGAENAWIMKDWSPSGGGSGDNDKVTQTPEYIGGSDTASHPLLLAYKNVDYFEDEDTEGVYKTSGLSYSGYYTNLELTNYDGESGDGHILSISPDDICRNSWWGTNNTYKGINDIADKLDSITGGDNSATLTCHDLLISHYSEGPSISISDNDIEKTSCWHDTEDSLQDTIDDIYTRLDHGVLSLADLADYATNGYFTVEPLDSPAIETNGKNITISDYVELRVSDLINTGYHGWGGSYISSLDAIIEHILSIVDPHPSSESEPE